LSFPLGIERSFQGYGRDLPDGKRSDLAESASDRLSLPEFAKESVR
jgi:hypothetical protein